MHKPDMPPFPHRTSRQHLNSLQSSVLSAFNNSTHVPRSSRDGVKRRKRDAQVPVPMQHVSVINAVDDLCCVSTETGASCLSRLKQSLQNRSYSPAQLAVQLLICDEVDTGPPLCSAVSLLEEHLIHLKDVQPVALLNRAILELRNPDTCSCRGQKNGVQAMIRFILKVTTSSKRDLFVQCFLSVLFQERGSSSPIPQKNERFRLAEHLLCALQEEECHQEDASNIYEWVRQASLPIRVVTGMQSKSNFSYWTAELSGLATGGSTWEYLAYGKVEERALINLFKLLPPLKSMQVYLECLNSILRKTSRSSSTERTSGGWSRVVILGRRILDISTFSDANSELKRRIQSSLNALLAAAASSNECQDVAIILCLLRCILIPSRSLKEASSNPKDFREYESWFRDIVGKSDANSVMVLLTTLTELVPLEPLKILRVNHKVLSLRREHMRMASNYLVSIRARISDVDSTLSKRFLNPVHGNHVSTGSEQSIPSKTEDEVIQFVLDFSKQKLLSSCLMRKMNFHRYYFRTQLLKSLFDPTLSDRLHEKSFGGPLMSAALFDECRIEMIKELAFNRKDRAVKPGEAREAIDKILLAKHQTKKAGGSNGSRERSETAVAAESNSVKEICAAIFKESTAKSDRPVGNCIDVEEVAFSNVSVLVRKLEGMWKTAEEPVSGPEIAAQLLHGMTSALEEAGRSCYPAIFGYLSHVGCETLLKVYVDWWKSHGFGLVEAIRRLLERPSLGKMQKFLHYQLFALLCAGDGCLTPGSAISLAMFAIGFVETGKAASLMDSLMLSQSSTLASCQEFLSGLVSCLPLKQAKAVTVSATFAIHSICLLVTAYGHPPTSRTENPTFKINSRRIARQGVRLAESRAYKQLLDLLRWILCHPWRLSASPTQRSFHSRITMIGDAVSVINFVTRLLVSPRIPFSHDFTIEQYVCIEARCGWGQAESVYEELKKRESSEVHPSDTVCRFTLFLSKRSSSRLPSVVWMKEGLIRYAEETATCRALQMSGQANVSGALRFLERSVQSDGTEVGRRLLEYFSRMQVCYFHGYSDSDIEQHLTSALIPWYWPFSPQLVDFLWSSCSKHHLSLKNDLGRIRDNFLLVSNFALYGSRRENEVRGMQGHLMADEHSENMLWRISNLRQAMEELSAMESGLDRSLGSQGVTSLMPRYSLPAILANAFGSCAVLDLVQKCRLLQRQKRATQIRTRVSSVHTIIHEASLCDFLGTSLTVASVLPFTGDMEACGRNNEVTMITDAILIELVEEHVQLLSEGAGPFQWTRKILSSTIAHRLDLRKNIMMWLGWDGCEEMMGKKWNFESLPVDVCMGRLFRSMGYLRDESLYRFTSNVGWENLSNSLIPNILRTRRRLLSYLDCDKDLKLSQLTCRKLFDFREKLATEILAVVVRLLSSAREVFPDFGDGAVVEAVRLVPDCREEVISALTATISKGKEM